MVSTDGPAQSKERIAPLALTAAVHAALLWAWQVSRMAPPLPPDQARDAIQWLLLPAANRPDPSASPHPADKRSPARAAPSVTHSPAAPPVDAPSPSPAISAAPQAEAPRLIDRLAQARSELGKIDAEIRKERRGLISAPAHSPALRMQRKMAEAADLAPNKFYQAPKVSEIVDPGGYGRRRYKVVGPGGTYCITEESNHAPDGLDTMKNGIKPKLTNCPTYEQPATKQDW